MRTTALLVALCLILVSVATAANYFEQDYFDQANDEYSDYEDYEEDYEVMAASAVKTVLKSKDKIYSGPSTDNQLYSPSQNYYLHVQGGKIAVID